MENIVTKKCGNCNQFKDLSFFAKHRNYKDGLQTTCKECQAIYREKNREKLNLYFRDYDKRNKERKREYGKQRYAQNKPEFQARNRQNYQKHKEDRNLKARLIKTL